MNAENNHYQAQPKPENYFVFPGLRELFMGTASIAGIEYLTGMSIMAAQPLQTIFLAMLAFIVVEIVLVGVIVLIAESSSPHPFAVIAIPTALFCGGVYLIGLIFPELAMIFPAYPAPRVPFIGSITWLNYLVYTTWKIILQLGRVYGWFTIIASGFLLAHIATRHGQAIKDKLNSV